MFCLTVLCSVLFYVSAGMFPLADPLCIVINIYCVPHNAFMCPQSLAVFCTVLSHVSAGKLILDSLCRI